MKKTRAVDLYVNPVFSFDKVLDSWCTYAKMTTAEQNERNQSIWVTPQISKGGLQSFLP